MATISILPSGSWSYTRETSTIAVSASGSTVHFNMGYKLTDEMANAKAYIPINMSNYKTITMKYSSRTGDGISSISFGVFSSTSAGSDSGKGVTDITSKSSGTVTIDVSSLTGTHYVGFLFYGNTYSLNENVGWSVQQKVVISSLQAVESSFKITASAGTGISSVSPSSQTIQVGEASNPITATPAPGYYWGYWSDGTTTNPYPSFTVTAAKTLTAYGYGNSYKIYYNGNGSTSGSMSYSSHVYGTTKTLTANSYKKIGYTFIGWNTLANGNGTSYSDAQSITTWTPIPSHNSSITLYAQWRPNTYEIQYNPNWPGDSNLGSGIMDNSFHTYDIEYTLSLNLYDYHRKRFLNWNTKADGTGTTYLNGQSIKNLISTDNAVFNLYAIWIPDGTVRIEINNESKMAQAYIYYNGKWRLTTPYTYHNEKWKLNGG